MSPKKLPRLPPTSVVLIKGELSKDDLNTFNAMLTELDYMLTQASRVFRDSSYGGRHGQMLALDAACTFMERFALLRSKGLTTPLQVLKNALIALDSNNVQPCLKPKPKKGRATASMMNTIVRMRAIHSTEQLTRLGLAAPEADKAVARTLAKAGFKAGRGAGHITDRTIRGWREAAAADVSNDELLSAALSVVREDERNDPLFKLPKEQAISRINARLSNVISAWRGSDLS